MNSPTSEVAESSDDCSIANHVEPARKKFRGKKSAVTVNAGDVSFITDIIVFVSH